MRCAEFEERFQGLLDERQLPGEDASLQAHALICSDCRELLLGEQRLTELLSQDLAHLDPGFSRGIVAAAMAPAAVASRRKWLISAVAALAATLLIALLPLGNRLRTSTAWTPANAHTEAGSTRASSPGPGTGTIATWQIQPARPGAVKEAGAPETRTGITAAESEEFRRLVKDFLATLPDVPDSQLEPIDQIAGGLRPFASTLGFALDAIRRSISVGREEQPSDPQARFPKDRPAADRWA